MPSSSRPRSGIRARIARPSTVSPMASRVRPSATSAATWLRESCRSSDSRGERLVEAAAATEDVHQIRHRQTPGDEIGGGRRSLREPHDGLLAATGGFQGAAQVHQAVGAVHLFVVECGTRELEISLGLVAIVEDLGDVAVVNQPCPRQVCGPKRPARVVRRDDLLVQPMPPRRRSAPEDPDRGVHGARVPRSVEVLDRNEVGLHVRRGSASWARSASGSAWSRSSASMESTHSPVA